jgi:drug/metabolite transporter (DMT)-like permease
MTASQKQEQSSEMSPLSIVFVLGLVVMFGSNSVAIKISLSGLGVYFTAAMRFLVASLCLLIWARLTGQSLRIERKKWPRLFIVCLAFSAQLLFIYTGLSKTAASRAALINNLQPFFVLFLAHFFIPGDRINLRKIMGISLAFAGMAVVFLNDSTIVSEVRSGDLLILAGTFIWGCNAVYTKHVFDDFKPIHIALYPMIFSVPISFTASLLLDPEMIRYIDASIIGAFAYQSFIAAAFGFVAWNTMLKKYGAVSLHSFIFIMPIAGVSLGGLVLGETITYRLLIGLVLVVTGLLVIHIRQKTFPPIFPMSRNV